MPRYTLLVPLLSAVVGSAVAGTSQVSTIDAGKLTESGKPWSCHTASDARARKIQVEHGMLPQVVLDGETKPASVESRMAVHKTPALSVAVVRNGKLDWSAAWGRLQTMGARADCGSLFQAGSIAKPVAVFAALRMQTAEVIDFDKNVETYLSSYHLPAGRQTDANPVTLRNLLAHTSGITPGGYAGYAQNEPIPTDQQIALGEAPANSRKVEVLNTPRSSLAYSGGGYTVVEIALQDRFHQPFDRIMREWLLAPVGMRQADFAMPLAASNHPHVARGHRIDGTLVPGGWNNYPEQAAAGLWATATDLAMFLIELRRGFEGKSRVFTQASIRELLANPVENHAYGFRLVGQGEQVFITHYGGTVGYRAGMTMNLPTGDGAVFLTNSDEGANLGEEFLSAVSRAYAWPSFRAERVQRMEQSPAVLQSLAGEYVFPDQAWKVSVTPGRDAITLTFPKGDRLPLVMVPIRGRPLEFVHETGVHAWFDGEGQNKTIWLFGQTGQRQASGE
jgi:CubicO group peptidase (beta-lactamase class C family)